MSVAIGSVRGGQVVVEGDREPLPEGRRVKLIIEDDDTGFQLDAVSSGSARSAVRDSARELRDRRADG